MPKLSPIHYGLLCCVFERAGFRQAREEGSHLIYTKTGVTRPIVIPKYRLFFYSAGRDEPPHIHVEQGGSGAKFWLDPVHLERSRGFGRVELLRVERLIGEHAAKLLRERHEYFGD